MLDIIKKSRDFDRIETYLMTMSPAIISMKDVPDGTSITVDGYLTFIETKDDGTETEIISVITPDKKVYSAQSCTFKRSLYDIANLFDGETYAILKTSGVTKAGRDYINCELDVAFLTN